MNPPAAQALFIPAGPPWSGQRLCIYHAPAAARPVGLVVYVHPWLEEMNKSRRMAAMQSRAMAANGYAVLQIDLLGCGDSSGELRDASWDAWVADVLLAVSWLRARHDAPLWLWGLRAGCLVAAAAGRSLAEPCHWLMWQATPQGRNVLQQFLRLKAAADLQGGAGKGLMQELREQLNAGQSVQVAGYEVPAALALGLEAASLQPPPPRAQRLLWLELSTRDDAALLPASATPLQAWQTAGAQVLSKVVNGPAFWQTTEIEDAPALLQATGDALAPPAP